MNSMDAIAIISSNIRDEDLVLSTTGYISRYVFSGNDRMSNFYMLGSMGLVSSVGLGIALNTSKKVIILDGDGSALMDMGTMAMVSRHRPDNLIHVVLDNKAYQSTGGQPTISGSVNLASIAKAAGYKHCVEFNNQIDLKKEFAKTIKRTGPVFVLVNLRKDNIAEAARISVSPEAITARFRRTINNKLATVKTVRGKKKK